MPSGVMIRKFKKAVNNQTYRKSVQTLLDLIKRNEDVIAAERAKLRDKSLKDPAKLTQQFSAQISSIELPLVKESARLTERNQERINLRITAALKK